MLATVWLLWAFRSVAGMLLGIDEETRSFALYEACYG